MADDMLADRSSLDCHRLKRFLNNSKKHTNQYFRTARVINKSGKNTASVSVNPSSCSQLSDQKI